jgi:formylglycine-generating enzyme required for sulfatase activity
MTQKKAILCVGIDSFEKGISPLLGAANDARKLGSVFELLLGFQVTVLTHDDLKSGRNLMGTAEKMLDGFGEGDVFGLFLATHGKEVPARNERVFLLPQARRSSLEGGAYGEGLLPLSQLANETARRGVSRFFIFDACRSHIEAELAEAQDRDGDEANDGFCFEGEGIDRDVVETFRRRLGTAQSPLVIVNSCTNGQRAKELRSQQRGLFSLSAEEVLNDYVRAGRPVAIGEALIADIAGVMQRKASYHGLQSEGQRPNIEGQPLPIWARDDTLAVRRKQLLDEFERQLSAGELEEPMGRSARDTLARLHAVGLAGPEHDALLVRLRQAVADKLLRANEAYDQDLIDKALADPTEASWNQVRWLAKLDPARHRAKEEIERVRIHAAAAASTAAVAALAAEQAAAAQRMAVEQEAGRRAAQDAEARAASQAAAQLVAKQQLEAQEQAWQAACGLDTAQAYTEFLLAWPQGGHADDAMARQEDVRRREAALQRNRDALAAQAAERAHRDRERKAEAERLVELERQAELLRRQEQSAWLAISQLAPRGKTELIQAMARCATYLETHPDGAHLKQVRSSQATWQAALNAQIAGRKRVISLDDLLKAVPVVVIGAVTWWALDWWYGGAESPPIGSKSAGPATLLRVDEPLPVSPEALRPAAKAVIAPSAVASRYRRLEDVMQVAGCVACGEVTVVEAGSFEMGSPANEPERQADEGPVRTVRVDKFEIGRTEVTQGQWKAVMGSNPSAFKACGDMCPVEQVSWNDITGPNGFLAKLNKLTGQSYRLPSEAEWEYAARAATKTAYWWGNGINPGQANYDGNYVYKGGGSKGAYRMKTVGADEFESNRWGLYNVHGNVREWVQDCYRVPYFVGPETGCTTMRVLRGGSWRSGPKALRVAYRWWETPSTRDDAVGFRVAKTL